MDHYRRLRGSENFCFVDITSPAFDANREGVDAYKVHRVMHVKRADGSLATGVDAFVEIWRRLPQYRWVAYVSNQVWLKPLLRLGYHVFAAVRPYLPKRKRDCEASPYCDSRAR